MAKIIDFETARLKREKGKEGDGKNNKIDLAENSDQKRREKIKEIEKTLESFEEYIIEYKKQWDEEGLGKIRSRLTTFLGELANLREKIEEENINWTAIAMSMDDKYEELMEENEQEADETYGVEISKMEDRQEDLRKLLLKLNNISIRVKKLLESSE